MVELPATIRNAHGIHCRPSAAIVKALAGYEGHMAVATDSGQCDPRSIMGLLSLCLQEGTKARVQVEGPDELKQARRLVVLLETHFDFPPRSPGDDTQTLLRNADTVQPPT